MKRNDFIELISNAIDPHPDGYNWGKAAEKVLAEYDRQAAEIDRLSRGTTNINRQFVNRLAPDELQVLMYILLKVYEDGNLYEWVCSELKIGVDDYRHLFEEIVLMSEF